MHGTTIKRSRSNFNANFNVNFNVLLTKYVVHLLVKIKRTLLMSYWMFTVVGMALGTVSLSCGAFVKVFQDYMDICWGCNADAWCDCHCL
jgi:hypothetical protein